MNKNKINGFQLLLFSFIVLSIQVKGNLFKRFLKLPFIQNPRNPENIHSRIRTMSEFVDVEVAKQGNEITASIKLNEIGINDTSIWTKFNLIDVGKILTNEITKQLKQEAVEEEHISLTSAHYIFEKDANNLGSTTKKRKINFGTAMNREIPRAVLKYLPPFVRYEDTAYQLMTGSEEFRQFVASSTPFTANEVIAVNSFDAALSMFFRVYAEVSVEGKSSQELDNILSFGRASIVSSEESKVHVIFIPKDAKTEDVIEIARNYQGTAKPLILVIDQIAQLFDPSLIEHKNYSDLFFIHNSVYDASHGTACGLVFSKNEKLLDHFGEESSFVALSSLFQGGIARNGWQSIPVLDNASNALAQSMVRMIQEHEGVPNVSANNIFFITRASSALSSIAQVVFRPGDVLAIDAPYYGSFRDDFGHVGCTLEPIQFDSRAPRNTLLTRVKRAKEDGFAGFIICNPHNPTGYVYRAEEVHELCQWLTEEYEKYNSDGKVRGEGEKEFHVIFDELYAHSIWDLSQHPEFFTGLHFIERNPWIHVVRGFAKDFGLCGCSVGITLSSNKLIHSSFHQWKTMFQPSNFVLSILNDLVINTNYGKIIFDENQGLLNNHLTKICSLLDEEGIDYYKPSSGIFIMINLSKVLQKYPRFNEFYLWKKIVDEFSLNISPGKS